MISDCSDLKTEINQLEPIDEDKYQNKRNFSYDEEEINLQSKKNLLIKTFLILIIQFIIIFIFTWLGFDEDWNDKFIEDTDNIGYICFSITIVITILCFYLFLYPEKIKPYIFVLNIVYIFCITFYLYLLSNYTDTDNILVGFSLIILDVTVLLIYTLFLFNAKNYVLFIILFIANIIAMISFGFTALKDSKNAIISISFIGLGFILYFYVLTLNFQDTIFKCAIFKVNEEQFVFASLIYDLTIFSPVTILVVVGLIIYFLTQVDWESILEEEDDDENENN